MPSNFRKNNNRGSREFSLVKRFLIDDGYELGGIIGEGSYSKVRMAERDGEKLAIKIISKTKTSKIYLKDFLPRELAILSKIEHPNIVDIIRLVEIEDHVCIFMEYAEKGDLLTQIKNQGLLLENRAKKYFHDLVQAVIYLHSKNICHRDLKCENLLITSNDVIKVADFGFSKEVGETIQSNTFCGSAAYASPELLQCIPYNPMLNDVWSIGIILFIMVTGSMPFDDSNLRSMLEHQLASRFACPSYFQNKISAACIKLIKDILTPDMTQRPTVFQINGDYWLRH